MKALRKISLTLLALAVPQVAFAFGPYSSGASGYDVSYPNCSAAAPADGSFGIVGVTSGRAFTQNSCLGLQALWFSGKTLSLYMNTNYAVGSTAKQNTSGPIKCAKNDKSCTAHNYGWNSAQNALNYASTQVPSALEAVWWMDVETGNSWSSDKSLNIATIRGALDYFHSQGITVGIYSTPYQWNSITGGYQLIGAPNWVATGASDASTAISYCSGHDFTGGGTWLTQYLSTFDTDYACP